MKTFGTVVSVAGHSGQMSDEKNVLAKCLECLNVSFLVFFDLDDAARRKAGRRRTSSVLRY
jgi:hypothetical protein